MATLYNVLRRIVDHQDVQLIGGLLLFGFTTISIFTDYLSLHHGVFAIAIGNAIPNLLQAIERVAKGIKRN